MASIEAALAAVVHHVESEVAAAVAVVRGQAAADLVALKAEVARNRAVLAADLRLAISTAKTDVNAVKAAVEAALKAHDL
jgi:hypothetical protein